MLWPKPAPQADKSPAKIAIPGCHAVDPVKWDVSKGSVSIELVRAGRDETVLRRSLGGLAKA